MGASSEESCKVADTVADGIASTLPDVSSGVGYDRIYGVRIADEIEVRLTGEQYRGGYAAYRVTLAPDANEEAIRAAERQLVQEICDELDEDSLFDGP